MHSMIPRLLQLPDDESFFLFGPRGVGKTTLLKHLPWFPQALYINLLQSGEEQRFSRNPDELALIVKALPKEVKHIIIDEVQKIPKLLDIVHDLIETTSKKFILTGSSVRKLKHGGANLLAGRAFVYHLYPFSYLEIAQPFNLINCLSWGMLPKIFFYFRRYYAGTSTLFCSIQLTYIVKAVTALKCLNQFDILILAFQLINVIDLLAKQFVLNIN